MRFITSTQIIFCRALPEILQLSQYIGSGLFIRRPFLGRYIAPLKIRRKSLSSSYCIDLAKYHLAEQDYENLGIQTSPLLEEGCYHRVTRNALLTKIYETYAYFLGLCAHEVFVINSPLIKEVFARELPQTALNLTIDSKEAYEKLIDTLLLNAKSGQFPAHRLFIDFSKYLGTHPMAPKEIKLKIVPEFEDILVDKVQNFLISNPAIKPEDISNQLLSQLHLLAFMKHDDQHLLLIPEFLLAMRFDKSMNALLNRSSVMNRHGAAYRMIDSMISRTGFRLDPAQAKETWLKIQDLKTILASYALPMARFAMRDSSIPTVCANFQDFMQMPVVKKFKDLSKKEPLTPYLQVMPEATWSL